MSGSCRHEAAGTISRASSRWRSRRVRRGAPPRAVRALFAIRWKLGEFLGWDTSEGPARWLRDRLPAELRDTPAPPFVALPFTSLYRLDDGSPPRSPVGPCTDASPRLGPRGAGHLSRPDGGARQAERSAGTAYMSAIRPFRHAIVYPAMIGQMERAWRTPSGDPAPAPASP